MTEKPIYDVIIIGGGVSGLSAALYTARQGLKTLVISMDIGGQLSYASLIENYPGVEAVKGLDLVLKIQRQAISFNAEILIDEVVGLEKHEKVFSVKTKKKGVFNSLTVIAACGKAPRRLNLPDEDRFVGKGLSYCVICDAPLYRNKDVVLVSYGEKAVESISLLASVASHVYYITRYEKDHSLEEARKYSNVTSFPGYEVSGILGEDRVSGVLITDKTGNTREIATSGVFVELGFETKIDFLREFVDLNEKNEIKVDQYGRTKTDGLFAAGDLVETPYKQAVIAAASGVIAALSAINYVYKLKGVSKEIRSDWAKTRETSISKKSFKL
ncbi:MAG: FAD-dependent oxidoreductase [Desulfurococcaceae archaeon]